MPGRLRAHSLKISIGDPLEHFILENQSAFSSDFNKKQMRIVFERAYLLTNRHSAAETDIELEQQAMKLF